MIDAAARTDWTEVEILAAIIGVSDNLMLAAGAGDRSLRPTIEPATTSKRSRPRCSFFGKSCSLYKCRSTGGFAFARTKADAHEAVGIAESLGIGPYGFASHS